MPLDEARLYLQVVSWSQTITHGEGRPQYQLHVIARTSAEEKLAVGAGGHVRLSDVSVNLTVHRGEPNDLGLSEFSKRFSLGRALVELRERGLDGIGELVFDRGRVFGNLADIFFEDHIFGWFWLPEGLYDEIWLQMREDRHDKCVVELAFRPVELDGDTQRWNTEKNKIASITCGGVRFERKSQASVQKELTAEKKSRELARIERRYKLILLGILAAIVAYEVYFRWWHTG